MGLLEIRIIRIYQFHPRTIISSLLIPFPPRHSPCGLDAFAVEADNDVTAAAGASHGGVARLAHDAADVVQGRRRLQGIADVDHNVRRGEEHGLLAGHGHTVVGVDEVVQQNEAVSILLKKIRKYHVP